MDQEKRQEKRLKIDLHIHTHHSTDSKNDPEELVRKATDQGFDMIAVTDHGTTRGALDAEIAAERIFQEEGKELIVIVGQEVKTRQGEILAYGIREDIQEGMDLLKTCQEIKSKGGFLIVPHPFDLMRRGIGQEINNIREYVDAAEGFNERTLVTRFNDKAISFLRKNSIPVVVGSDAHFNDEFGKTYMLIESGGNNKKSKEDVFDAIRNGKTEFITQKHGRAYSFKRGLKKIKTYF
ncbi:CehA/McbA family metallohydrolase [Candidatus Aenigmatarchaeota archaeon]